MNSRKTILLGTIFLILAGGYYYFEVRLHSEKVESEKKKKRIIPFKAEEIEEIRLIKPGGLIHLKKTNGQWGLLKPVVTKADQTVVDGFIRTIVNAETQRIIDENPEDLRTFGLDRPRMKLEITAKGREPSLLLFGEKNPTEVFYYAKTGKDPKVFVVYDRLWKEIDRKPFSLRDKTFASLNPEKVTKVAIDSMGKHFELKKDDKGAWRITTPIMTAGDRDGIDYFLRRIQRTRVKAFIDIPEEPLSRYGLNPPSARLSWWIGGEAQSILLGKIKEGEELVYAELPDSKGIVLVDDEVLNKLPKDLYDLREKRLLDIDKEKVQKIEWDSGDQTIVCEKKGEDLWEISKPTRLRADFFAVNDVLWALQDGRVKRFYDQHPEALKGDEFNKISLRLGFWEEDKKDGQWLTLGKEDKDLGGVFVRIGEGKEVYLANKRLLEEIRKTVFDLRDKSLLSFESKEIIRLQVKTSEKKYDLKRSGKKWKLMEPQKGKSDPNKVNALLASIGLVKFKAILEEGSSNLGPYGLDKASMEIQLWTEKGDRLGPLLIGMEVPEKNGMVYGRVGQGALIYGVDVKGIEEIKKELEELVESS